VLELLGQRVARTPFGAYETADDRAVATGLTDHVRLR
jgi:hypothetical protein